MYISREVRDVVTDYEGIQNLLTDILNPRGEGVVIDMSQ